MRLLAVDIGNTNVTMALLEDGHVRECCRMETARPQEADYARTATALTGRWGPWTGPPCAPWCLSGRNCSAGPSAIPPAMSRWWCAGIPRRG